MAKKNRKEKKKKKSHRRVYHHHHNHHHHRHVKSNLESSTLMALSKNNEIYREAFTKLKIPYPQIKNPLGFFRIPLVRKAIRYLLTSNGRQSTTLVKKYVQVSILEPPFPSVDSLVKSEERNDSKCKEAYQLSQSESLSLTSLTGPMKGDVKEEENSVTNASMTCPKLVLNNKTVCCAPSGQNATEAEGMRNAEEMREAVSNTGKRNEPKYRPRYKLNSDKSHEFSDWEAEQSSDDDSDPYPPYDT